MVATCGWQDRRNPATLCLFDVDGTLTPSRRTVTPAMLALLAELKKHVVIGFVGGSDLAKQKEQLGEATVMELFDFAFSENGATAFRCGRQIAQESFIGYLGEEKYKQLVDWTLRYLADLDIPIKRGTFIEYRNGMVNVSPIGRNCSHEERLAFDALDKQRGIRKQMVRAYEQRFPDLGLQFSIGGQISIDIFPRGWDKTNCLKHLAGEGFAAIHFFGDMTHQARETAADV
jgi:phosphomannomutase